MASEDYVSSDNQVDEISHNYQSIVTEPTCELAGYTTFICTRCGDSYVGNETAALGHNYQSIVTEPTCTKDGNETYTCTTCGDSYVLYETAAIGHCYDLEVIEPTCLEAGYETYTCTTCGDRYVRDETAALGHDYQTIVTDPTCEMAGYTTFVCTRCSESYVGDETAALGHDYQTIVTDPTCEMAGYTTYICSRCGDSYVGDEVSQIPHTVVTDAAVPATCTTTGLTEGTHCSVCETVLTTQEIVEKLAHNYTETVVAPTTTSTGYTIYTCSSCGDSYKGNITAKLTTATVTLAKPTVTLSNTSSGVKITCSKVSGAKGYIVYRRVAGGKFATLTKITNSGTTTFTDKTAKAGTTYYYTVKAYSGSTYSSYVTNKLIKYLKQPTVNLLNASKGVKVTWTKTSGASGYYIYRKTANGSFTKIKNITSGSTVSFTDTTAKAGTTYYYTVKAYAKSGAKTYSSSYVTNKTIKRLTQPTVTLTKVSNGVKIAWKKITGASGYYLYRKTASGSWNKIKTISSASTTSFVDTTAKKGTTYYYTVKAYNGSSFSSYITNKKIKID
jgi:DNA-directed RNA polymerase subunit RPC12/RpoP